MIRKYTMIVLMTFLSSATFAHQVKIKSINHDLLTKNGDEIQFGVVGDYGDNSKGEKNVSQLLLNLHPNFIITTGDNNYPDGCWETIDKNVGKYYSSYIGNYTGQYGSGGGMNEFFPTMGNHDWEALKNCMYYGELPYLAYFTLPNNGRYYDFIKGTVHFYAIDSDDAEPDGNKIDSIQYEWLKNKIKQSDSCFNVVYFHHSPYSSGEHGSDKTMRWKFDELGADVVISGHDHDYERIMRDNMVYIVNGVGGADLTPFEDKVEGSVVRYNKEHGYMMGYANDERLRFSFFNTEDELIDSVVIRKNCKK